MKCKAFDFGLNLRPDGRLYPCHACSNEGYFTDTMCQPLLLGTQYSQDDLRSSREFLVQQKHNILQSICKSCIDAEKRGEESDKDEIELSLAQLPHSEKQPYRVDLFLGNRHFLAPRFLTPRNSSLLQDEWKASHLSMPKDNPSPETPVATLLQFVPSKRPLVLRFTGGEPLMMESHLLFLECLVRRGDAGRFALIYNTFLPQIPMELFKLWTFFYSLRFDIQLPAIGRFYEYLVGSPHNFWESFIAEIDRVKYAVPLSKKSILFVLPISVFNIFHLPDVLAFCSAYKESSVTFYEESEIPLLSLQNLPVALAERLINVHLSNRARKLLIGRDFTGNFDRFTLYANRLDRYRKTSILDFVPEFESFWTDII